MLPAMLPGSPQRPLHTTLALRLAVCQVLRLHPERCLDSSLQLLLQDVPSFLVRQVAVQRIQPLEEVLQGFVQY
jgi:hypothetical protein